MAQTLPALLALNLSERIIEKKANGFRHTKKMQTVEKHLNTC